MLTLHTFSMQWAHWMCLILAIMRVSSNDDKSNEVTTPYLESNLRKALLRALTELENEETKKMENTQHQDEANLPHLDTSNKIVEKASASAVSFFAKSDPIISTTLKTEVKTEEPKKEEKPSVFIQKSSGVQHNSIITFDPSSIDPIEDQEQFLTSASNSFTSPNNKLAYVKSEQTRSVDGGAKVNIVTDNKADSKLSKLKIETTTVTPTTSTDESEAKVEDVQFFSAPLVAAFTVHQDEQGLPKSVVPIYKHLGPLNISGKKTDEKQKYREEESTQQILKLQQLDSEWRQKVAIQEKHRALEHEIIQLRKQKQQQDQLLEQQKKVYEQQLHAQRNKLLEEQSRVLNNQNTFVPIVNSQNNFVNQNRLLSNQFNRDTNNRFKGTLVSLQPSVSFIPPQPLTNSLPLNAQFLPVKNAGDFGSSFKTQNLFRSFNNQQNAVPLVNTATNFKLIQSLQPSQQSLDQRTQSNRVFRHETDTGNFLNNNYNNNRFSYNPFPAPQQNRFFRSNQESTQNNFNNLNNFQHLNNLLYYSGLGRGRELEDLNIVSKVLSLNHFGNDAYDSRYAGSYINEHRVPAPLIRLV